MGRPRYATRNSSVQPYRVDGAEFSNCAEVGPITAGYERRGLERPDAAVPLGRGIKEASPR